MKGGIHMKDKKKLNQEKALEEITETKESELKVEESLEKPKKEKKKKKEADEKLKEEKQDKKAAKEPKEPKTKKEKKAKRVKKTKKLKNRVRSTKKYFRKFTGREKADFASFVNEDYKKAITRAESLLSIDKKAYAQPVLISTPNSFDNTSKVQYRLDKKEDGTFTQIYDQALVTIMFFGNEALFYYQANINHRTGQIGSDISGEFNYFDVVHVETRLRYDQPAKPKYLMLDLKVGLTDGRTIPIHLRNHRIYDGYGVPEVLTETEQKILDTLKTKIRKGKSL